MPTRERVEAFIARVVSGAHAEAIEEFYHEDASMQENMNTPRVGRDLLAAQERATLARHKAVFTHPVTDWFIDGDKVVIHWIFAFTRVDDTVMRIEELAFQVWRDDRIQTERFFYDPAQMKA
jgi:ketosteroid isomerase-like protein